MATSTSSFTLPGVDPPVRVQLTPDLSQDQLLSFPPFANWLSTVHRSLARQEDASHAFHSKPYTLRGITVQAVDYFGPKKLGFVKFKADVSTDDGDKLPGSVFLRGGSVGMLLILQPDDLPDSSNDEKQVVLTVQPRIPAGSLTFTELPAGMIDEHGSFAGAAAQEIHEETGLVIKQDELINMSSLALLTKDRKAGEDDDLQSAVYPSPGGCDEFIPLFLCEKRLPRQDIQQMQGKFTGLRKEGEMITLKLVPLSRLWKEAAKDAKALSAWALYQGLKQDGRL
ncbi:nudix hydrolase 14 [Nannizzia gypsea CBS 118893]|uniref:Nudix hydrolase 14 n=1 Tax=Arthroderma gypseum (strain ATCC MYA-4604 / CBS 118893) TaxID=535722 RepID=E4UTV4_ARTGP|nr:nudix hydrolase 14 [Nannizzia gypsea CBS 118893]EFR00760.1 nudix hydrolase 14 [Nannizzia gypsea CBS 118893]